MEHFAADANRILGSGRRVAIGLAWDHRRELELHPQLAGSLEGCARSTPTSGALDLAARSLFVSGSLADSGSCISLYFVRSAVRTLHLARSADVTSHLARRVGHHDVVLRAHGRRDDHTSCI